MEGAKVTVRLEGQSRAVDPKHPRGVETVLHGRATWDGATKRFVAFELTAAGSRWGGTGQGKSNDRSQEKGPRGIGFTFELASDSPADRVPPLYVLAY